MVAFKVVVPPKQMVGGATVTLTMGFETIFTDATAELMASQPKLADVTCTR